MSGQLVELESDQVWYPKSSVIGVLKVPDPSSVAPQVAVDWYFCHVKLSDQATNCMCP